MSRVTEQLNVIENKLDAIMREQNLVHDHSTATAERTQKLLKCCDEVFERTVDVKNHTNNIEIMVNEMQRDMETREKDDDLLCEFNELDELADNQREYINFLEDRLIELCDKWERLYKKNKRLKKKVKRLSAYIDEMENVELS